MNDSIPPARAARKNPTRLVLLGLGLAVLAALLWFRHGGKADDAGAKPAAPRAVAVDVAAASYADVPVYLQGIGNVQATYTVTITPRVDGELQKVAFVEGQQVKKGDLLAQIDPRPYQAAYDQAVAAKAKDEAQLANAQVDLKRYQGLIAKNYTSRQTLDTQGALINQLRAQIRADQAAIDNARTQLDYTRIVSPIDGRTGIRLVDPGNNVHASDTTGIVKVTQLQPITAIFTLPEDQLEAVQQALAEGRVEVIALPRDNHTELDRGSLSLIDNQIDPATGTIRLKASFPNLRNALWPGQFINARLLLKTQPHALVIPSSAVQRGPDGTFAYVLKPDRTVEARPLRLAGEHGGQSVVNAGLKEGEQVVTSNQYRLEPGALVQPGLHEQEAPGEETAVRRGSGGA